MCNVSRAVCLTSSLEESVGSTITAYPLPQTPHPVAGRVVATGGLERTTSISMVVNLECQERSLGVS